MSEGGWRGAVGDIQTGVRFVQQMPRFLRRRWTTETARVELERRLRNRASDFLDVARRLIFDYDGSPYLPLLRRAGCDFGDLAGLVERDGIEAALASLCRAGVFLTIDELKANRPVVRGGAQVDFDPEGLRNPSTAVHLSMKSGGSRSRGTPVFFDLTFIHDCALDTGLALHCRGGDAWRKATWEIPGGGALFSLLEFSQFGALPVRWFSQLDPREARLPAKYRWSGVAFTWGARLAGAAVPSPEFVPLDNALPIARWMADTLRRGEVPYLLSYPSSALRVCQAALDAGIDLSGAHCTIAGEPCSQARIDFIRRTGATVLPKYAIMETGPVGYGCMAPEASDDLHLLEDVHAIVQAGPAETSGLLPDASLLFTSLRASAPLVLLNVSMGDQADVVRRRCGCPLEGIGWPTHVHSIRSAEKLTCGGMNFIDSDVMRVLDELLPARFGGGPSDFQVVEEESEIGEPLLTLVGRPSLGAVDERAAIDTFIQGISQTGGANPIMAMAWQAGHRLRVERREPMATTSGKILHMHVTARREA